MLQVLVAKQDGIRALTVDTSFEGIFTLHLTNETSKHPTLYGL